MRIAEDKLELNENDLINNKGSKMGDMNKEVDKAQMDGRARWKRVQRISH